MSFILNAGDLRQQVTLLQPTTTRDAAGQPVASWAAVATVWAQLLSMVSREAALAGAVDGQATVGFRIRWRDGVLPTWRVQWRGTLYELTGTPIDVRGQRVAMDLMCIEARA